MHQTKASTMSLSVLVLIEMFNAMNSLSENESLLQLGLHRNMYLVVAIITSMILHMMILELPFFYPIFNTCHLTLGEWKGVFMISFPVIFIDEGLKLLTRIVYPVRKVKMT